MINHHSFFIIINLFTCMYIIIYLYMLYYIINIFYIDIKNGHKISVKNVKKKKCKKQVYAVLFFAAFLLF